MDIEELVIWNRRKFIRRVGFAILTVQSLPLIATASENLARDGDDQDDTLTIHSGPGLLSHVHDLLIPYQLLKAPPLKGVQLTTTQAFLHRHDIALTQDQLATVGQGGSIVTKASSHLFTIALNKDVRLR